jgi:hypothetical protein
LNRRAPKHRILQSYRRFLQTSLGGKKWSAQSRTFIITWLLRIRNALRFFCQNYGAAGAIDFFGPNLGLPPAISGHQNYFLWGPRDWTGEVALVLNTDDENERELFGSVIDLGQVVSSPWAMPYERRNHIYLCRDLKTSVRELWPHVKKWL